MPGEAIVTVEQPTLTRIRRGSSSYRDQHAGIPNALRRLDDRLLPSLALALAGLVATPFARPRCSASTTSGATTRRRPLRRPRLVGGRLVRVRRRAGPVHRALRRRPRDDRLRRCGWRQGHRPGAGKTFQGAWFSGYEDVASRSRCTSTARWWRLDRARDLRDADVAGQRLRRPGRQRGRLQRRAGRLRDGRLHVLRRARARAGADGAAGGGPAGAGRRRAPPRLNARSQTTPTLQSGMP